MPCSLRPRLPLRRPMRTVDRSDTHLQRIYVKLGITSRTELGTALAHRLTDQ